MPELDLDGCFELLKAIAQQWIEDARSDPVDLAQVADWLELTPATVLARWRHPNKQPLPRLVGFPSGHACETCGREIRYTSEYRKGPRPRYCSISCRHAANKRNKGTNDEPKGISPGEIRDNALVLFLADTGCRVDGLVGLRLADLDLDACQALVIEKGDKARRVFFSEATRAALLAWLAIRPALTDYVWVKLTHKKVGLGMTTGTVKEVLRRLKLPANEVMTKPKPAFDSDLAERVRGLLASGAELQDLPHPAGFPAGRYHRQRYQADVYYIFYSWKEAGGKRRYQSVTKTKLCAISGPARERKEASNGKDKAKKSEHRKSVDCPVCGGEIQYTSEKAGAFRRRYCSDQCQRRGQNDRRNDRNNGGRALHYQAE